MTLTLELTPEEEARLHTLAACQGTDMATVLRGLIPAPTTDQRRQAAIALLQSWRDVDEAGAQEQRETYDFLEKALNEDRLSYRRRL